MLLLDQDRSRWDLLLIGRGLAALERAEALRGPLGPYGLQAAIAACHARARDAPRRPTGCGSPPSTTPSPSSPPRPSSSSTAPSPSAWPSAPRPASNCWTRIADEPALRGYHLLPSVRGDLLAKLGRRDEAAAEFERAAALTENDRERELLLRRAEESAEAEPRLSRRIPSRSRRQHLPVVEPGGAELVVEAQGRLVPVEGAPFEADVAALEGEGGEVLHHRAADAAAALRRAARRRPRSRRRSGTRRWRRW